MELTIQLITLALLLAGSALVFFLVVENDLGPAQARSLLRIRRRAPQRPADTSLRRAA